MSEDMELDTLTGEIISVIFRNEETGYSVLKVDSQESGEPEVAVGCIPFAWPGQILYSEGRWENSNHGKQFRVTMVSILQPNTENSIYQFLSSGVVKGIGPVTASMLVNKFGNDTLSVLANSPERISEVKGISFSKAKLLQDEFNRQSVMNRLSEFISNNTLRPIIAVRLYRCYGLSAVEILENNPYIIASSGIGGSFYEADALALSFGEEGMSENRMRAAVVFELNYNTGNGHCFIPREKLCEAVSRLISVDSQDVDSTIEGLISDGQIIQENVAGCNACYLPNLYEAEVNSAEILRDMISNPAPLSVSTERFAARMEKKHNITYSQQQKDAIRLACDSRVLIVTGGPGTGKTTSIKALFSLFDSLGMKTILTAPTGRAAKRMSEVAGREAYTVHRLLEAKIAEDEATVYFDRNEDNPLDCEVVILDECSMVDILLLSALLNALPSKTRLVLVGDADQLPSVGPGNVFSALIRSGVIPVVTLNTIFRQGTGSSIVSNAHLINEGEHPNFADNSGDFFRLKRSGAQAITDTIVELCARRLPENMKIPSSDIQVLSATRKGDLGTVRLNEKLQEALNPAAPNKKEKSFGEKIYRDGDRVMQIKNDYDMTWSSLNGTVKGMGIYNGDIGTILEVNNDSGFLMIDFDGKLVEYGFDFLPELEHAWAITVHKSQGSEYPAVVLALNDFSSMLLTRDVLYTAVSRAKRILIMVGDDAIAYRMIDNYKQSKRYCALRYRLKQLCEQ